ncbi:hypothetical protein TorRG33x02_027970 [Trema orientale]|uniref:Uncharacterized protein n=1 Tax=Trema orientale TaxID=63057 RepID=A0A2P5FUM0_TREOI|nr:hypothetical protein TorRG33x02_027970 [Trema orientale]
MTTTVTFLDKNRVGIGPEDLKLTILALKPLEYSLLTFLKPKDLQVFPDSSRGLHSDPKTVPIGPNRKFFDILLRHESEIANDVHNLMVSIHGDYDPTSLIGDPPTHLSSRLTRPTSLNDCLAFSRSP